MSSNLQTTPKHNSPQVESTKPWEQFSAKSRNLFILGTLLILSFSTIFAVKYQRENSSHQAWLTLQQQWYVGDTDSATLYRDLFALALNHPQWAQEIKPSLVSWALKQGKSKEAEQLLALKPNKKFFLYLSKDNDSTKSAQQMLMLFNSFSKSLLEFEAIARSGKSDPTLQEHREDLWKKGELFFQTFPTLDAITLGNLQNDSAIMSYLYFHHAIRQVVLANQWNISSDCADAKYRLLAIMGINALPANVELFIDSVNANSTVSELIEQKMSARASALTKEARAQLRGNFTAYLYDELSKLKIPSAK